MILYIRSFSGILEVLEVLVGFSEILEVLVGFYTS